MAHTGTTTTTEDTIPVTLVRRLLKMEGRLLLPNRSCEVGVPTTSHVLYPATKVVIRALLLKQKFAPTIYAESGFCASQTDEYGVIH